MSSLPLGFLLLTLGGWMTRDHHHVAEYLLVENAVLRQQRRGRRLRFTDAQRRRLATPAKKFGRTALRQLGTLVRLETLLRWYRQRVVRTTAARNVRTFDCVESPTSFALVPRMAKKFDLANSRRFAMQQRKRLHPGHREGERGPAAPW